MTIQVHAETPAVDCRCLDLCYRETQVVRNVDLAVAPGEVLALLGPSGSGKTTLLHAIAGLVVPRTGEIWLSDQLVSGPGRMVPPERRRIGMVFQNYALWPHMSVLDTVAYPIRRHGGSKAEARQRAHELLARTDLASLANRKPGQLSGGQAQRVGLARALAAEPDVYLFDEPTAHLDAHLRALILEEVARRRAMTGAAALYSTHDAAEALAIADRVAVVHDNELAQVGTPAEVYDHPADLTVARLTGPISILTAGVSLPGHGRVRLQFGGRVVEVEGDGGGPVAPATLIVRPDWAALGGDLPGTVTAVRYRGTHTDYHLDTAAGGVLIRHGGPPRLSAGTQTTWSLRRVRLLT